MGGEFKNFTNGRGCFEVCGKEFFLLEERSGGQYPIICHVIDIAAHKTLGKSIVESDPNIAQLKRSSSIDVFL